MVFMTTQVSGCYLGKKSCLKNIIATCVCTFSSLMVVVCPFCCFLPSEVWSCPLSLGPDSWWNTGNRIVRPLNHELKVLQEWLHRQVGPGGGWSEDGWPVKKKKEEYSIYWYGCNTISAITS